jgi:hypothetical protein
MRSMRLADDRLAVGGRGGGCAPQGGDVRSQPANRRSLLGAQDRWLCGEEAGVLSLEARLFGQRSLPLPLERAGHQPGLGLDRIKLAESTLRLVLCPLEPLCPLGLKALLRPLSSPPGP